MEVQEYRWELKSMQELRLEIDQHPLYVKITEGTCEINGCEMGLNKEYKLTDTKLFLYTYHSCVVEAKGVLSVEYIADKSMMSVYLNAFISLENLRQEAELKDENGPIVLIAGPIDSGKSTFAKIMLNYSLKLGREPIFVDLDPFEGSISIPETLSATTIKHFISVENGFKDLTNLAPPSLKKKDTTSSSLVYYYGNENVKNNTKLYNLLTDKISENVCKKMKINKIAKYSGCIIDTNGCVDKDGTLELIQLLPKFKVGIVFVMGHERLYNELIKLSKDLALKTTFLLLPKSGGVVSRDPLFIKKNKQNLIKNYFYGCGDNSEYSPFTIVVSFSDVNIFKIGAGSLAPNTALPIGHERKVTETRMTKVEPNTMLLNVVLAVSSACSQDEVLTSNALGFVYISEVNEEKQSLTLLVPSAGKLPSKYLILGSLQWVED